MHVTDAPAPHAELSALIAALPRVDENAVATALEDAKLRPIRYPIGSGQGDEIALRSGLRPMIRELLVPSDVDRERVRLERAGFRTGVVPRAYRKTSYGWDNAGSAEEEGGRRVLFVSRDEARIPAGIACDLEKSKEADRELGRLLGYPRCCVDAFVDVTLPRRNPDVERAALARTVGPLEPRLNGVDLSVFHFLGWFPCSYTCRWSLAYANALAERVARIDAAFVARIDAALASHRMLFTDDVQVSIAGRLDGHAVLVESAWPTARDRHPDAKLDPQQLDAAARATAAIRASKRVEIVDSVLRLDERTVDLPAPALLMPFGNR